MVLPFPVIDNDELAKILHINADGDLPGFTSAKVSRRCTASRAGERRSPQRIEEICAQVSNDITRGVRFFVLSDRDSDDDLAPIPSLLLTAAVHHHLVRTKQRTEVSLLVEAGDVREVHHVALLIGYGAAAVNPYLAMETVEDLAAPGIIDVSREKAIRNLIKALGKGVLKVMSKMGISTVASYRGAQVFEAVGLAAERHRPLLHRNRLQAGRHRAGRHRCGGRQAAQRGVPVQRHLAVAPTPRRRRGVPVAARG